jgi:hypothetical protein
VPDATTPTAQPTPPQAPPPWPAINAEDFARHLRPEVATWPPQPKPTDTQPAANQATMRRLENRMLALEGRLSRLLAEHPELTTNFPPLFLAKDGADSGEWTERSISAGATDSFPGGRYCDDNTHTSAYLEPAADEFFLWQVYDIAGACYRFVKLKGGADNTVVVKVTGNAAGGGKYLGRILTGDSTAAAAGNLSMPEGLTVPGADDALVLSVLEDGSADHEIGANTYWMGYKGGTSGDGKTIVYGWPIKLESCTTNDSAPSEWLFG